MLHLVSGASSGAGASLGAGASPGTCASPCAAIKIQTQYYNN